MKNLVLITSNFPFGTGEPFIETELPFLYKMFDKIIILACNTFSKSTRNIPENVRVFRYNTSTSATGFLLLPFLISRNLSLISEIYRDEINFRKQIDFILSPGQKFLLFKKIIKAIQLRDFVKSALIKEKTGSEIVFYSYWLNTAAHAIGLLHYKGAIKIARAHGSDLYEEKSKSRFLPLLRFSASKLDAIFFVSQQGQKYFEAKTRYWDPKLIISMLGVEIPDHNKDQKGDAGKYLIVSCSNMIPLKRIDLLINSLGLVQVKKELMWLHFGDGPLKHELENLASEKLARRQGINYRFMGHIPNAELLKFYNENKVNLFVNVSITEGLPVSIMEAQSYGIPVIATETGGVAELVVEGTGTLLPLNIKPEELAKYIEQYSDLSTEAEAQISIRAIKNIKSNFNAGMNYEYFIRKVNSILASAKE